MPRFEVLNHPQMLHAIVVHFPVALAILLIPLVYLCAVTEQARSILQRVALSGYILLVIFSILAVAFGELAMAQVPGTIHPDALKMLANHEAMAEKLWMLSAGTALFLALSLIRYPWVKSTALALALVASIATGLWVVVVGHLGGTLVYEYGVGTPSVMVDEPAPTVSSEMPVPETAPAPSVAPIPPETIPSVPDSVPAEIPAPAPEAEMIPSPLSTAEPNTTPPVPEPAPPVIESPGVESAAPEVTPEPEPMPAPEATENASEKKPLIPVHSIEPELAAQVSFFKDVRPILARHCVVCHNPSNLSGGQDLTSVAAMLRPGEAAGAAVVPGRPGQSAIVRYIRGELQPQMPKGSDPLTDGELHVIREWIAAGATDDTPVPTESPQESTVPAEPANGIANL